MRRKFKFVRLFLFIALLQFCRAYAQDTTHVLFLGNSFTEVNNLPDVFFQLATKAGKIVYTDKVAPGGFTLNQHSVNTASLQKIQERHWDYVVLQEQSQIPSFIPQRETLMYPYAIALDSTIHSNFLCTRTVFFMTWAHKNGNLGLPPGSDTYEAMQQRLRSGYMTIADSLDAAVAPCGWAWRYVRQNHPSIELYSSDDYHPAMEGTYLAACTFYAALFQSSAIGIGYYAGLSAGDAAILQSAASQIVLDSLLLWNTGLYDPSPNAGFTWVPNGFQFQFLNNSGSASSYLWNFGNGDTSTLENPVYTYADTGNYVVTLITEYECGSDTLSQIIHIGPSGIDTRENASLLLFPNPASDKLCLQMKGNFSHKTLMIFNVDGKQILNFNIENVNECFDVSSLNPGLYLARIQTDDRIISRIFVKK